jgi:hypothetical protein
LGEETVTIGHRVLKYSGIEDSDSVKMASSGGMVAARLDGRSGCCRDESDTETDSRVRRSQPNPALINALLALSIGIAIENSKGCTRIISLSLSLSRSD